MLIYARENEDDVPLEKHELLLRGSLVVAERRPSGVAVCSQRRPPRRTWEERAGHQLEARGITARMPLAYLGGRGESSGRASLGPSSERKGGDSRAPER